MIRRMLMIGLGVLVCAGPVHADEFVHEANVMARLGNHPNVVTFIGARTLDIPLTKSATGGNNPLYESRPFGGENPLYSIAGEPGTPGAVQSISFELDNTAQTPHLHAEGIVHRDIAARNFIVSTNQGVYTSAPGELLLFGNDGPPDLRSNVGPIRWMAPESLRLHRSGSTDPNDWIEVAEFSYFETTYVPEPGSLGLLALGMGMLARRRGRVLS